MSGRKTSAQERLYVQLVCSLYDTLIPASIMSAGFVLAFALMAVEASNPVLAALAGIGVTSSTWRLVVLLLGRAEVASASPGADRARILEKRFAIAYFQFAILLGVASSYALVAALPRFQILIVCLLVGYGAGAAVGVGLRPKIAIPSMITAIAPAIVAVGLHWDPINWLTSALMLALLIGGIMSLLARYRIASSQIAERFTFETLAREDNLTSLPNRLALREWYDRHLALADRDERFAVHCLDLDKFKPVNDVFGHPVGDALLRAVSQRLSRTLRPGDIVARLGGDEFAIIQRKIESPDEALSLARRLREAIDEPFAIDGHTLNVSACIGISLSEGVKPDLEELLSNADQALYRAKRSGSGLELFAPAGQVRLAS